MVYPQGELVLDIPEVLLEIQAKNGIVNDFSHISEANAQVEDLPISICVVLVAEACHIGIESLVQKYSPILTMRTAH